MKTMNEKTAIAIAIAYADVERQKPEQCRAVRDADLYEVTFRTDELVYDCYVDVESGEVLGFSFEPWDFSQTAEKSAA